MVGREPETFGGRPNRRSLAIAQSRIVAGVRRTRGATAITIAPWAGLSIPESAAALAGHARNEADRQRGGLRPLGMGCQRPGRTVIPPRVGDAIQPT
jgi:hypothetical protein